MPTGYTHELLEKKLSFPQFALLCARAFGATILMRDDPFDKPIPDTFEPSESYSKWEQEYRDKVANLEAMDTQQRLNFGLSLKKERVTMLERELDRCSEEDKVMRDMQEEVREWQPPSPDHEGMKKFMLEQLGTSLHGDYYKDVLKEACLKSVMDYFNGELESARRMVESSQRNNQEEIERTNGRNLWVRQLRESLRVAGSSRDQRGIGGRSGKSRVTRKRAEVGVLGKHAEGIRLHQFRYRCYVHFVHHFRSMSFDGFDADA